MSEIEAKLKVSDIQKQNANKNAKKYKPEYSLFRKEYWMIKKRLSENDAIKKVSELQSRLSLKSSKFKGKIRTDESKIKISNSLKSKIELVGRGNWARHFGEFNGNSKIEKEVFLYIKKNLNANVKANVPINKYVVDIIDGKKIIEFYGDFWHANPKYFKMNDKIKSFNINKTAEEIWLHDKQRIDFLESLGYNVLIIWECDWKKNKTECISLIKKYYENVN
jgi:G:T-mismatch repair DNA endonuclease (very short patch repair protein)